MRASTSSRRTSPRRCSARSPERAPDVAGIEVGHVYQSAARVDVGGDVYDFLRLDDGGSR
jgi:serine phosphatase RsbU (regulator of sigma subunit)